MIRRSAAVARSGAASGAVDATACETSPYKRLKRARIEHDSPVAHAVGLVKAALISAENEKVAAGQFKYLKGAVKFHGLYMPQVTALYRSLHAECAEILHSSRDAGLPGAFTLALLSDPYHESKMFGIYFAQQYMLDDFRGNPELLAMFGPAFDAGHVAEWSTCDTLCGKILSKLVAPDTVNAERCARYLATWQHAPTLWQRRAACVAMVPIAKHGDGNFAGFLELALGICGSAVKDPERFAQLGVGWLLRELALADAPAVSQFLVDNKQYMSAEAVRSAREKVRV